MSIHPSLNISEKDKQQRSVLKRTERLRNMLEKNKWKEGDSVYGLPKIKAMKLKIKKDKVEKAETAEGAVAEGAAPAAATPAKAAPAKAAPAKAAPAKGKEK